MTDKRREDKLVDNVLNEYSKKHPGGYLARRKSKKKYGLMLTGGELVTFILAVVLLIAAFAARSNSNQDIQEHLPTDTEQERVAREAHLDEVEAYRSALRIEKVDYQPHKKSGDVEAWGSIINIGNRETGDIELTIYCLDEGHKPICKHTATASSTDGQPLKKYERRRFKTVIPGAPEQSIDYIVTVTDIDFAE